jgi:HK97 family phage portal protein
MKPFFSRLFGGPAEAKVSRTAPLVALSGAGRAVWSSREAGALTAASFARNAIAYRCVKMISEGAASIHFDVFNGGDELDDHPIGRLLSRPNPRQAGPDFLEATFVNLLCFGNAYIELVADGRTPREIYTLRPDRVKVHPGPDGWPEAYEYSANGGSVLLRAEGDMPSVLHLRMFDPLDDHYGMAPLAAAHVAVDIHNAASSWNKALLDNSARPSGALVYASGGENMTDEAFERLKEELETTFSGAFNAGRPILLEGGLDWKPLALTPKDMDFMEAKSAAAREIALALGVPPLLLGLPGDNTYANFAEANRALWRQTILPLVERTLKAITHWLEPAYGPGLRLAIDYDRIEALASERDALWKRLEAASFLTTEEKRTAAGYRNDGRAAGTATAKGGLGVKPTGPFDFLSALRPPRVKYSPDQPRDERGRWASGGSGGGGDSVDNPVVQLAGDITGFTKHGINQAITRGVSPAAILDAVTNPIKIVPRPDGSTQYRGAGATVVLNPTGEVVTMWRTR